MELKKYKEQSQTLKDNLQTAFDNLKTDIQNKKHQIDFDKAVQELQKLSTENSFELIKGKDYTTQEVLSLWSNRLDLNTDLSNFLVSINDQIKSFLL